MKNISEQQIQKTIIDYLRFKKYVVFKHHSTGSTIREGKPVYFAHGEKGISDIIACSPKGTFVAIEVKKPGGRPSPEQLDFLARVKANNGIGILAYSLDEVMEVIEGSPRVHLSVA